MKTFIPPKTINTQIKKPVIDTSLNPIEWINAKIFTTKFDMEIKMWNTVKSFLVSKIVQWIFKIGAGALLALGISQGTVEEVVGGIVSALVGIVWSLITHQKVALTEPKEFLFK